MKKGHKKWLTVAVLAVGVIAPAIVPARLAGLLADVGLLLVDALDEPPAEEPDRSSAS